MTNKPTAKLIADHHTFEYWIDRVEKEMERVRRTININVESGGVFVDEYLDQLVDRQLCHTFLVTQQKRIAELESALNACNDLEEIISPVYCPSCGTCGFEGCCVERDPKDCAKQEDCTHGAGKEINKTQRVAAHIKKQDMLLTNYRDKADKLEMALELWQQMWPGMRDCVVNEVAWHMKDAHKDNMDAAYKYGEQVLQHKEKEDAD